MAASMSCLKFRCGHFQRQTAEGVLCNCLVGALPYTLRDTIIPLVRSESSPPRTDDLARSPAVTDRQKNPNKNGTLVV